MRPLAALLVLSMLTAPAAAQLIPDGATPEKVADGYRFTEGPAAGPDGCIYFTDIPAELILKYDPATGETETFIEGSGQANGLMFRGERLFYCAHRSRVLGVYEEERFIPTAPDGHLHDNLYAMCTQYESKLLNSPNDLDIDRRGHIYFTDPRYGNRDSMELEVEGVYFFDPRKLIDIHLFPDGEAPEGFADPIRIIDDLTRPNGIVLSPDESILYVADNGTNEIFAYDIEAPGEIENKRLFARLNDGEGGGPDGMCVDAQGRLYAAGQGKVWIYNPDGSAAGVIEVGPQCTNCTFANDGKTLYITANHGLYRIELDTDAALTGANPDDRAGWLGDEGVAIEVSAMLPRAISPNAATSIEPEQSTTPWQVRQGVQASILQTAGGRRTTMTQIWSPPGFQMVRLVMDEAGYAALLDWVGEGADPRALRLVDGEESPYFLHGFAWQHGDSRLGLSVRDLDRNGRLFLNVFDLETEPSSVYLYFLVPLETEVTGLSYREKSLRFEDAVEVDR